MDFSWDIFTVGFWFTAGMLTCGVLVGIIGLTALRLVTDWEYKKNMKGGQKCYL